MKQNAVVITGISGGIGVWLGRVFRANGDFVLGLGRERPQDDEVCDAFVQCDLRDIGRDESAIEAIWPEIVVALDGRNVRTLINNAAEQLLGSTGELAWQAWQDTLSVNLSAPFALTRAFLPDLRAVQGSVINIGSVHAQATKPEFVAYATSKAALHGLTRALAIDLGPDVRVVCLAPAAISTPMLNAGFDGRPDAFAALEGVHSVKRIGTPKEVAQVALFLASPEAGFISGGTIYQDGGILSRLHDPI